MSWPVLACALALAPAAGVLHPVDRTMVVGQTQSTSPSGLCDAGPFRRGGPKPLFLGLGASSAPANCDVAVGPGAIVQVVNGRIAFFSKDGELLFEQDAAGFFGGLAMTPSPQEPRAVYDDLAGRFVVAFVENDVPAQVSNVLLAVSDDDDPAGAWNQYRIDCVRVQGPVSYWMERPGLGYNAEGVIVTGTHFAYGTGSEGGSSFFVVQKPALLSGGPISVVRILDTAKEYAQVGETPASNYLFGATQVATNKIRVYRVQGIAAGTPVIQFVDATCVNTPVAPVTVSSTGGASLETHTDSVMSVEWRSDRLLVAANSLFGASMSGVRWHVFDTTNFTTLNVPVVASGLVSSGSVNYFMPAVALNKWLDAGVIFSGSSASVTSDVLCAGRVAGDAGTFMSVPAVLAVGSGSPYLDTRWGGQFGMDVDPVDGETFWGTAMAVSAGGWWETHVVPFTVSKTWPVAPNAFNWFRGNHQSGNVASLASDDGDYNVATSGAVPFPTEPPAQLVVDGTAPAGQVLGIDVRTVSKVNTTGLSQKIELFDWVGNAYVQIGGTQGSTMTDSTQTGSAGGTLSRFVQAGTQKVRAKLSYFVTGTTFLFVWTVSVDQVEWRIRVR